MSKAILVRELGDADKLLWEEVPHRAPGPGEALVRHTAIGVNFVDVYFRTGLYPSAAMPFTPGQEAAGVVEALGEGVSDLAVGDRVAYGGVQGAYAERRTIPAERLVKLPDDISDETAAAMMLKGMTAEYLLLRCAKVRRGDKVLVHAAAGGVGLILCQWARHLGVEVIGTVSSAEKARLAFDNGCAHVVNYVKENFVHQVHEITYKEGVHVVFDSVGKTTFRASLDCLRGRGLMVSFGQSSGALPPFDLRVLSAKGSLFLTRPTLGAYTATRHELLESATALFDVVRTGAVRITVGQRFALADAAEAHRALEGRRTTGSTVLRP